MKTLSIAITMIFIYGTAFAQGTSYHSPVPTANNPSVRTEVKNEQRPELGDLKGPRAKNFPKYKYDASKAAVEVPQERAERRVGPDAKNYQPWEDDARTQHVIVSQKKKKNLKGPRAKNQKPWDN